MSMEIWQPGLDFENNANREDKHMETVETSSAVHEPITKENLLKVLADVEAGNKRTQKGQLILMRGNVGDVKTFGFLAEVPGLTGLFPSILEDDEQALCQELLELTSKKDEVKPSISVPAETSVKTPVQEFKNVDTEDHDDENIIGRTADGKPIYGQTRYDHTKGYQ